LAALAGSVAQARSDDAAVRYLGHDEVTAAFAKGKPMIEVRDYKIHASRRETPGMAEIHTRDTDIAYVCVILLLSVLKGIAASAKVKTVEPAGKTRQPLSTI